MCLPARMKMSVLFWPACAALIGDARGVYLALQVTLAVLELGHAAAALLQHGVLSLHGALQPQVLLTGALTGQRPALQCLLYN